MYLQTLILALTVAVSTTEASKGAPDYHALFAADWSAAETYAAANRGEWSGIFAAFGLDPQLAEAVVFPEMVRYSSLRDAAERAAVRALYQQRGSRGADFSIGRFQMKPSFAERVEREWMASPESAAWGIAFDTAGTPDARRARVRRLDDPVWQCTYLAMFLKQLYARHPGLARVAPQRQVRLCAAAYNGGGADDLEAMERLSERAFFHTDFLPGPKTEYHSYSDIAEYYYNTLK
jgi:hypothetical protein